MLCRKKTLLQEKFIKNHERNLYSQVPNIKEEQPVILPRKQ